jgi:hypothetical protein
MGTGVAPNTGVGIVNANFTIGSTGSLKWVGGNPSSVALYSDGVVYINGSGVGSVVTWTEGDAIDMYVDFNDTPSIGFRKNGGNWNNNVANLPRTNAKDISAVVSDNGTLFAAVQVQQAGGVVTVNFGGSAYTYSAPGGASNW